MRSPLFILVAAFLISLLIAQYAGSFRAFEETPASANSLNGSDLLLTLLRRDQSLGPALAATDHGDNAPLLAWLNAAEPFTRQSLARVLMHIAWSHDGLKSDDDSELADAAVYRYRQRFTAFVNIPTGNADLDATLDNLLAYVLVAGTRHPTAQDVALAKHILPRIEKHVEHVPSSGEWDTIGCVYYAAGEDAKAKAAFQHAMTLAEQELAKTPTEKKPAAERTLNLAHRRLQAAQEADLRGIEKRGDPYTRAPLPLIETAPSTSTSPLTEAAHGH